MTGNETMLSKTLSQKVAKFCAPTPRQASKKQPHASAQQSVVHSPPVASLNPKTPVGVASSSPTLGFKAKDRTQAVWAE